jgi:BirA family biotin operon repressor/biotin-[acetyl-CoA-carboxylase] ligase
MTGAGDRNTPSAATTARRWRIRRVAETGSTNADLALAAATGESDGAVLVADVQNSGRGRLGRQWEAPAGSSLMFSVLLRPLRIPAATRGWVGAVLGIAIVDAIAGLGLQTTLKWPNDVLHGDRKVAGILAEMAGDAVVVGAGINVSQDQTDLPGPTATSLRLAGAANLDRDALLDTVLGCLGSWLDRWESCSGDVVASGVRAGYLARLSTLGSRVTVHLPDGRDLRGLARGVGMDGALIVDGDDGMTHRFSAGDVIHLRR